MSPLRAVSWLSGLIAVNLIVLSTPAHAQDKKPKRERDLITRDELVEADSKFPDLYEAIKRLRPHFVQVNRGYRTTGIQPGASRDACIGSRDPNCGMRESGSAATPPVVYMDGTKAGDLEILKGYRTSDIDEVRYLNANAAAAEYGLGHEGGAILVKRRRP